MKRSKSQQLGLPIIGKFGGFVTAGVPPRIMGIGPAFAIPKLWAKTGLKEEDIDFYEINEGSLLSLLTFFAEIVLIFLHFLLLRNSFRESGMPSFSFEVLNESAVGTYRLFPLLRQLCPSTPYISHMKKCTRLIHKK